MDTYNRLITPEQLSEFSLLRNVGNSERRDLLDAAELRDIKPGTALIRKGEYNDTMYLLLQGQLAVYLDECNGDPIAVIERGETVGELSLLDGRLTSAHVIATSAVKVLAIGDRAFWNLINASHAFAASLLVSLSARLRANNASIKTNVEKQRIFEHAAMFDVLTGIYNRRWLTDTLQRLVTQQQNTPGKLSLSLIDVDHFKYFNDTYGHEAGDHVLTTVAQVLATQIRSTDFVARFGGEEFVIIWSDSDLATAKIAAERVRKAVATQTLVMADGRVLPNVTISTGVAQFAKGDGVLDLLKAADSAMYRAKQGGRNRVEAADCVE